MPRPTQPPLLAPEPPWLPDLLGAVAEHEYLASRQLGALLGQSDDALRVVLDRLVRDGQLRQLEQPGTGASAYALTRRGAKLLAELTGDEPVPVGRARNPYMLSHELVKNDLAVVLQLLDAEGRLKLVAWETAREAIADAVHLVRGTKPVRIPLVADALAVVEIAGRKTALLVEIDMATVSMSRMSAKYGAYCAWKRLRGDERRFGTRSLRVLTIAKHAPRMARLRAAASESAGSGMGGFLWFATTDVLDPERPEKLLESRFQTAHPDEGSRPLFPELPRSALPIPPAA